MTIERISKVGIVGSKKNPSKNIIIPKTIVDTFQIEKGDYIRWKVIDNQIIIEKIE